MEEDLVLVSLLRVSSEVNVAVLHFLAPVFIEVIKIFLLLLFLFLFLNAG